MAMFRTDLRTADMGDQREAMVREQLRDVGDPAVLNAMRSVPRELFVPPRLRHFAYADQALPIGHGQTISQPAMVASMLEAAELCDTDIVLEVGAGCGYQAALLGRLARHVYAVELIPKLAQRASAHIAQIGAANVTILVGDGSRGLPEHAPFDAILVAAAAPRMPEALIEQLAEGGRLIIPVSSAWSDILKRVRKHKGRASTETLGRCRFVPLIMD